MKLIYYSCKFNLFIILLLYFSCIFIQFSQCHNLKQYDGLKLLRIYPNNQWQLNSLLKLEELEYGVDFWRRPDQVNRLTDLMITPQNSEQVFNFLKQRNITNYEVRSVKSMIEAEQLELNKQRIQLQNYSTFAINGPQFWATYQRYDDIANFMSNLEKENPFLVKRISIGKSYESRELYGLKISNDNSDTKNVVYIQGGIHAREWIGPAFVTYFANYLVAKSQNDPQVKSLLDKFDFYLIPVLNPDGYEYTHTTYRLWRKTRSSSKSGSTCLGTDPNRNFGYKWGGKGCSTNPCSETFRGDEAFSEMETKAERDFILNKLKDRVKVYLAIHSYGQYWLYPWGYDNVLSKDDKKLNEKAKIAVDAIAKRYQKKYTYGTSANVLYAAAGGSDDWAYSVNIPYSYTVELRDTGNYGFQLPPNQIIPTSEEATDGTIAMLTAIKSEF